MKVLFAAAFALYASTGLAMADEGNPIYRANCFIDDMSKEIGENTQAQKKVALKDGEAAVVGEYQGKSLDVWLVDMTDEASSRPRRQLTLTVRDVATKKRIASSIHIFSQEMPDVVLDMGGGVNYRCFATDL